jgi:sugar/nucleoside kinase (ribokinase family)
MTDIPNYLAVGHITRDLLPDGNTAAGGTALYTAITAERLGMRAAVFTAAKQLPERYPETIQIVSSPTDSTSTFENRYGPNGRQQWLHAQAPWISPADLPAAWREVPLVHLGPVLHECDLSFVDLFPKARVILTPQGLMRAWDSQLPAPIRYQAWEPRPEELRKLSAVVMSIEDVMGDESKAEQYAQDCPIVVLTRSAKGATLYLDGKPHSIPARPSIERDPTGAGDVFAAAFAIHLHETNDPIVAANFAAEIAGRSVEGPGISAIPQRTRPEAEASENS